METRHEHIDGHTMTIEYPLGYELVLELYKGGKMYTMHNKQVIAVTDLAGMSILLFEKMQGVLQRFIKNYAEGRKTR